MPLKLKSFAMRFHPYFFFLPVLLEAMAPTFLPGGACLDVDFDFPAWCWLPPNGWSKGFIATPLTKGYLWCEACILLNMEPAFSNGFSTLPPPADKPIVARHRGFNCVVLPDGSFT